MFTKGSLFVRWFSFITAFFLVILSCFWGYTWSHREEFVQTAFSRLYPSYAVSVGSISFTASGTAVAQDISFFPKNGPEQKPLIIDRIVAKASFSSWARWALMPSTAPLHLASLTIQGSTEALLPDVAHPAELFVQIDSLVIEGT
jgi:hypothetical protein